MRNENYWANRIKIAQDKTFDRIYDEYVANIEKQYNRAILDIEKDILAWYQRFADNNELSFADAQKLLKSDELEEFKWTVQEYIEKGKENGISADWAKELENASARVHISRLESLKYQLRAHAEELTQGRIKNTTEASELAFTEGYYHTAFEFQKEIGVGFSLQSIDRVKLEKILNTPWTVDNQTFTARCWSDKAKLVEVINKELTRMIATGEAPKKTIERVAKQLETSKNNAGRVVMTESAYFATASQGECYKDLDVENYEVIETLDSHTCSFCGEMDGKVFPVNKMQAGSTAPPFHPWCRGTTAPYYEDMAGVGQRFARDIETGKAYYLPSDTTYEQWKAIQDAKYGEGSVDKARRSLYQTDPDMQQYERYVERLGEKEVGNYEDFKRLKKTNSDDWKNLQLKYRYKGIDERLLSRTPSYKVMRIEDGVPEQYNECAFSLNPTQKAVVYKYSDGNGECSAINTYAATGKVTSATAVNDFNELDGTIAEMYLPENTVVFRGTRRAYIEGLKEIEDNHKISEWTGRTVSIKSFASTSLFRDTAYESEVEMTILVPKDKLGAGYINEISHHHLNKIANEYEVVLQSNSKYDIIEAQYFNGKLFLVVEWLGVK